MRLEMTVTTKKTAKDRLIVALDVSSLDEARSIIEQLREDVGLFKVGLELITASGLELFELMRKERVNLFYDIKLHDIPNTVDRSVRNITRHGVMMFNLHASGGSAMMKAAATACTQTYEEMKAGKGSNVPSEKPLLIAVTVLTSISEDVLKNEIGVGSSPLDHVTNLAKLAKESGLDGVVASAREAASIRAACGAGFKIVTPGIRPSWAEANDQSRIITPADAIANGADYLVVGRPITSAKDRRNAARKVVEEMESAK